MTRLYLRDMVDERPYNGQKCLFLYGGHTFAGNYVEKAGAFVGTGNNIPLLKARYWLPLQDLRTMLAEREERT